MVDIQKAGTWKRIASWLFDSIILGVIAIGVAFLLSLAFGYDEYSRAVSSAYEKYEAEYNISFDLSVEEYDALSTEDKNRYDSAYQALLKDEEAIYAYNMTVNLSLITVSLAILVAVLVWEFVLPLVFGNGQTLGKKIFGICLVKPNCVRINHIQLLVRALLGKYTIEIMIPVYAVMMLLFGSLNMIVLLLVAVLFVGQIVSVIVTRENSPIHDLLSGTVAVDASSQMIFGSEEELLDFKKKQHAELIARKPY